MSTTKKIRTALISVYNKDGIGDIVKKLHELGVELLSTGGTQTYIESLGLPCKAVEDLTGYPSILGGRVKTSPPQGIRRHPCPSRQRIGQSRFREI